MKSYGLEEFIYLEDPGSEEELFGSLEEAYQDREPWLGYMWGPTQITSEAGPDPA